MLISQKFPIMFLCPVPKSKLSFPWKSFLPAPDPAISYCFYHIVSPSHIPVFAKSGKPCPSNGIVPATIRLNPYQEASSTDLPPGRRRVKKVPDAVYRRHRPSPPLINIFDLFRRIQPISVKTASLRLNEEMLLFVFMLILVPSVGRYSFLRLDWEDKKVRLYRCQCPLSGNPHFYDP